MSSISLTVVIPTYRRPGPLLECVRSLVEGSQLPAEIIVVGREGDRPTEDVLADAQKVCEGKTVLRSSWVTKPGHTPPIEEGLRLASGIIVAYVDDDVTVSGSWLDHLRGPFTSPEVGVVGGQVITPGSPPARLKGKPGRNSWYGKHWGNVTSLLGSSPIEVHGVMECNWAWRRQLLASLHFDPVLNFDDAAMYGLDLCLQAIRRGWRVIYEPRAIVLHHAAPRPPGLDRADRPRRTFSYARNYTYIMLKHLSWWRRPIFISWWFLIGERGGWGLLTVFADSVAGRMPRLGEVWGAFTGKVKGLLLSVWMERVRE